MATLLGNTYVFPLPSGGCCVCIAPNNTATMGRGLLGGTGGCAQQATAKNTTFGFRIANYGSASNLKNSVMVGYDVAQGFGNSAACNASCGNTLIGSKAGYDIRSGANGGVCAVGDRGPGGGYEEFVDVVILFLDIEPDGKINLEVVI